VPVRIKRKAFGNGPPDCVGKKRPGGKGNTKKREKEETGVEKGVNKWRQH
jgi:hypothetical protein